MESWLKARFVLDQNLFERTKRRTNLDNENIRARQFLLRPNKFAHWKTGKIEKYLKFESLHQSFVDLDMQAFIFSGNI